MGELQKDIIGQFALNDWYQQRNNEATIKGATDQIVPVQEMLKFQRRFRTREFQRSAIAGQRLEGLMTVPRTEAWVFHWFDVQHNDSGDLRFDLLLEPANTGFLSPRFYTVVRRDVSPNVNTPLVEAMAANPASGSLFDRRSGRPFEGLPGDIIRLITTNVVGTTVFNVFFRYQVVPPPVILETDRLFSGQTV